MDTRKTYLNVKCEFTEGGENAQDLILRSFLAFLYRKVSNGLLF